MVISPLAEASDKGTHYHPIYFYYVQKGYILSYNKLKIQVQSKECHPPLQIVEIDKVIMVIAQECATILEVLQQYEEASVQQIN